MKQVCIAMLLLISLSASSQRLIRGYHVAFSYGFLDKGDNITITDLDNATSYVGEATKGNAYSLFFGFPLDYGYGRHRFTLLPALDFTMADWPLEFENENIPFGRSADDSIKVSATIIMPQLGLHYRYHFFAGKLHFALGLGVDLKIPVSSQLSLTDKDKLEYTPENGFNYTMPYPTGSIFETADNPGIHISPRIGFDVYISRFFVFNIFYYRTVLNAGFDKSLLSGHIAGGISYMLPFGKDDDSRVLQQYKKQ